MTPIYIQKLKLLKKNEILGSTWKSNTNAIPFVLRTCVIAVPRSLKCVFFLQEFTPGSKLTFSQGRRFGVKKILLVIVLLLLLAGLAVGIYFIGDLFSPAQTKVSSDPCTEVGLFDVQIPNARFVTLVSHELPWCF